MFIFQYINQYIKYLVNYDASWTYINIYAERKQHQLTFNIYIYIRTYTIYGTYAKYCDISISQVFL